METVNLITKLILYGVRDFFCGIILGLREIYLKMNKPVKRSTERKCADNKTVFHELKECFIFNVCFLTPLYTFSLFQNHYLQKIHNYCFPNTDVSAFFVFVLSAIFWTLWIIPLFLVSKVLHFSWYQGIADSMVEHSGIKKRSFVSSSLFIADQVESIFVQLIFLLQSSLFFYLPIPAFFQSAINITHLSLLYSLYAFEYKWVHLGWSLPKRLNYICLKWPYFFGFGLPLSLITTYMFDSFVNNIGLFSFLFLVCLISSIVTVESKVQSFSLYISFFKPSYLIADIMFSRIPFISA